MIEEDQYKYSTFPLLPEGAIEYVVGDIKASAVGFLNHSTLENLRAKFDL